jgi:hypothetical protein
MFISTTAFLQTTNSRYNPTNLSVLNVFSQRKVKPPGNQLIFSEKEAIILKRMENQEEIK